MVSPHHDVLLPVTSITAEDAGKQIYELVAKEQVQAMLSSRHFVGVLRRHTKGPEDSIENMRRAQTKHTAGELAVLLVLAEDGFITGMATADPNLRLRQHRGIAKKMAPDNVAWPLAKTLRGMHPNIAAWTSEDFTGNKHTPRLLTAAYSELAKNHPGAPAYAVYAGPDYDQYGMLERMRITRTFNPWTIEPVSSNPAVHNALEYAGLQCLEMGYFDDTEDTHHKLPQSRLYSVEDPKAIPRIDISTGKLQNTK